VGENGLHGKKLALIRSLVIDVSNNSQSINAVIEILQ
jgi:hypothetical protein